MSRNKLKESELTELGRYVAEHMDSAMTTDEAIVSLVAIEAIARESGYSNEVADDITGESFRAWLVKTGKAHLYPEIF